MSGQGQSNSYTVSERNGCRLIAGAVPAGDFAKLIKGLPRNAVFDPDVARLLDVTFAMGIPEALAQLRSDPEVLQAARERTHAAHGDLPHAACEWLATGRHGVSSLTIFKQLSGKPVTDHEHHPSDPSDLGRCRRLLDQVPEYRSRLGEMAGLSPVWEKLVASWDELCALMDSEAPHWRDGEGVAKETYARMKALGC